MQLSVRLKYVRPAIKGCISVSADISVADLSRQRADRHGRMSWVAFSYNGHLLRNSGALAPLC